MKILGQRRRLPNLPLLLGEFAQAPVLELNETIFIRAMP
jgi:hypothetical protein